MRVITGPVREPLRKFVTESTVVELSAREERFVEAQGLTPIGVYQPEDVFLFGFPKSGTHWLQTLTAGVVFGIDLELAPLELVKNLVPGIGTSDYYRRYRTPTCFKGHDVPKPIYRRVVYLIRDGRDALASRSYHRTVLQQNVDPWQIRDKFGKWHEHVEAWQANPYDAEMLTMRYEDLKSSGIHELRRLCHFLGVEREDNVLTSVYDKASFAKLRAKEQREGHPLPGWPRDKPFFRRGEVGSYKDEVPTGVLSAFLAEAAPTLVRFGYPLDQLESSTASGESHRVEQSSA